ncbi:MAG: nicotinamidase [Rhodocyclales bacterium]|nr:nicotinamidase [Rhodocyclales bacterium]
MSVRLLAGDALILVDIQLDFLPGGSLAVPRGDEVVPALNRYLAVFRGLTLPVVATRDWHPPDHCSFREQGGIWPPHCVAGSDGARFAPLLDLPCEAHIVSKATAREKDAYSGFEGTDLDDWLKRAGVRRAFVGGLATDYCVLNTVRDALRLGYATFLLLDAVRAVDVQAGDGERAIDEMRRLGAEAIEIGDLAA